MGRRVKAIWAKRRVGSARAGMAPVRRRAGPPALLFLAVLVLPPGRGPAEEKELPGLLDLMELDAYERSEGLLRLCRGATPEHTRTLLEVAEQPDLAARHYGRLRLALRRTVGPDQLSWGLDKARHEDPVVRHLAVAVVGALRSAAAREALLGMLGSSHSDVRAAAALALRRYRGPEILAALKTLMGQGATPAERSCAGAGVAWIEGADDPNANPGRKALVLTGRKPETVPALANAQVISVPHATSALDDQELLGVVLARVHKGATLHVMFSGQTGRPAAGVGQLVKQLGLTLPGVAKGDPTSFICNLAEPHPLQDYVHDLYGWRISVRGKQPENVSHAASEVAEWSAVSRMAFVDWDRQEYAAPFCGLVQPGRACILDAPPTSGRGRVVLDLTGTSFAGSSETWRPLDLGRAHLRLWEFGVNYKALLQGPESIVPLKNIYRGSYGAMKIHQKIPAPYFRVDESVVTPHVPWAKPLAGGPVKVGFLMPEIMIRTAIEIRQRLDTEATWLPFAEEFFGGSQNRDRRGPPVIDAGSTLRLKRYLNVAQEAVLVIPAFDDGGGFFMKEYVCSWNAILPDLKVEILQAVRRGMGLVAIGPVFPGGAAALGGAEWIDPPADVLRTLPLDAPKVKSRMACYRLGKGRIVHLRPEILCGKVRSGLSLGAEFLVPGLMSPYTKRVSVDEYAFAWCGAAIHWASGRSQSDGAARDVSLTSRFGKRVSWERPRPAGILTGPAIEETRYLDEDGKVTGWSARRIGPERAAEPKVSLARRVIEIGDALKAELDVAGIDGAGQIRAEVTDLHGRIVGRVAAPIRDGRASVEIAPWKPVTRWHDLYVAVVQEGRPVVADAMWPFTVDVPPIDHRKDLCLYALPSPTMFIPGLKALGANGGNGVRDHFLPFLHEVPEKDRNAVKAWHPHDTMVRNGLEFHESYQWMAVPSGDAEGVPSPADPTALAGMQRRIARAGEAYKAYGMRRAIACDEFALDPHSSFSPETMAAFRRSLRRRYAALEKLNAAWGRDYASWHEVRPDTLSQALKRGNLVSWAQHRGFMEGLVANWVEQADRLLQEQVPGAAIGLSNASRSPDAGTDFEKLMRAGSLCMQYSFMDRLLPRDLSRPGMVLGYWEPITFDQTLPEKARHEALFMVNRYLLDHFSTQLVWWGFCDFQWPFLQPDLTPAWTFRPMVEERKVLQAGIDRVVLGATLDNAEVATLFSHASWRTLHALGKMHEKGLAVGHHWDQLMGVLDPMLIRGYAISVADLRRGRLDREKPKLLFLSGVVAMDEDCVAELEDYVREGGCVIADVLPGAFTEDCAPQDQGRIARLFGVTGDFSRRESTLGSVLPAGEPDALTAQGPFQALSGIDRKIAPLMGGLGAENEEAYGRIGKAIALVEHKTGKGKTLLLNFMLDKALAVGRWDPLEAKRKAAPVQKTVAEALANWAGLEPRLQVSCETEGAPPYPGNCVYVYRDGENLVLGLFCDGWFGRWERKVTVRLPEERSLYDLRSPGPPETGKEFTVAVPPWRAGYFVLTPEPLPELQATVKRGADGDLRVQLSGAGGRRVVLVGVSDASGRERPELAKEVDFVGEATVVVPIALYDPAGEWKITVRDVMTGQNVKETLDLRP